MQNARFDAKAFPDVFCLEEISHTQCESGCYDYRATLYHDRASIFVTFIAVQPDLQLRRGCFVSVDWLPTVNSNHGAVKVGGPVVRSCATSNFNPFQSVPHTWCVDRHQIECARDLWEVSSKQLRKMLIATFWNGLGVRRSVGRGWHAGNDFGCSSRSV